MTHFQEQQTMDALKRASVVEVMMVQILNFSDKYGCAPTLVIADSLLRPAFCKEFIQAKQLSVDATVANPVWIILPNGASVPLLFSPNQIKFLRLTHQGIKAEESI